jgi:hypothetical protein
MIGVPVPEYEMAYQLGSLILDMRPSRAESLFARKYDWQPVGLNIGDSSAFPGYSVYSLIDRQRFCWQRAFSF